MIKKGTSRLTVVTGSLAALLVVAGLAFANTPESTDTADTAAATASEDQGGTTGEAGTTTEQTENTTDAETTGDTTDTTTTGTTGETETTTSSARSRAANIDTPDDSPIPPKKLKFVDGHWTPWDPPAAPAGSDVYLITKGDTLWALAENDENLVDPYLWPLIWDKNRYILDSHWIYPGDPLTLPGPVTVVADESMPTDVTTEDPAGEDPTEIAMTIPVPEPPAGRPRGSGIWKKVNPDDAADHSEMMCSGYIRPERWDSDMFLYAAEEEHKMGYGPDDVLYMNHGRDDGVRPGDKFFVVHQEEMVEHPVSRQDVGWHIRKMAIVEVIASQGETATVEIIDGCDTVHLGYDLIRYSELVSPKKKDIDLARYGVEDNGNTSGYLIYSEGPWNALGDGDIVFIDLGMSDDVHKGDYLMIYRELVTDQKPNEAGLRRWRPHHKSSIPALDVREIARGKEIPRKMLGHMVVIDTNHHTATAKITYSWREIYHGDQVQILN